MSEVSDMVNALGYNRLTTEGVSTRKSPIELQNPIPHGLADDPFQFASISYPRDVTSDMANGHYILFYVNVQNKTKYYMDTQDGVPMGREIIIREGPANQHTRSEFISYADTHASYNEGLIQKGAPGSVLSTDGVDLRPGRTAKTGLASYFPTTRRITDSVALYMPAGSGKSDLSVVYDGAETGVIGLAAAGGVAFVNAMRRNDFAAASKSLVGSAKGIIMEAAKKMGSEFVGGLSGVDPEAITGLANKAFGQATNPYMEVLYRSTDLRSFTYSFTFAPRNPAETEDVQRIIKLFRFHMVPELQGSNERFITLPSTFDIHYMYQLSRDTAKESSFYSKIATCVLSSCNVDYAPEGVHSFESGAPTQIKMDLGFKETELITKQMVDAGY